MNNENNKMQVDIENLFKQNVNDISSIKELYRKLKEVEEKITQIKYIDSNLANKIKKEYEKLTKIILDENIQAKLANDIKTINSQLNTKASKEETKNEIKTINSQLDTKAKQIDLNTTNARIDNLIKNEGSSVNDIELQDIRVSVDGTIYNSAGNSIRSQIREVDSKIISYKSINLFDSSKVTLQGFMNGEVGETPTLRSNSSFVNYKLKVNAGEKYIVSGTSFSVLCLNSEGKIITKKSSPSADKPNYIINVDNNETDSVIINFKPSSYPINNYMIVKGEVMPDKYEKYFTPCFTFSGAQYYAKNEELADLEEKIIDLRIENYTVGATGDYATFTECIRALKNNSNKKEIIIEGGMYDIFEEIGGSAYALSIPEGSNWYDVCDIIPPNTTIKGKGNVIFNFKPTASEIGNIACKLLSPINVRGTCTIENITINADNCRYCIHDETSGDIQFEGSIKIYKNVICNKTSTGGVGYAQAYASGFDDNMIFEFDNCVFSSDNLPFSVHNRDTKSIDKSSRIKINNCKFLSGNVSQSSVRLGNINWRQENIIVDINNSYLNKKITIYDESGYGKKNGYNLTMCGCNDVEISITTETNIYEPKIYNL